MFASYVEAGLERDPNYADNIYNVNKARYNCNYWYRTVFSIDTLGTSKRIWINFEGITREGSVFLNGTRLGKLSGFYERGEYEISSQLRKNRENVLAVLVYYPHLPIPNYASPTYISSDGWDWMPSVAGLDSGITDDVYLSTSGAIMIEDPWIRSKVPSLDKAKLSMQITLKNNSYKEKEGTLTGTIQPGNIIFSKSIKWAEVGSERIIWMRKSLNNLLFIV